MDKHHCSLSPHTHRGYDDQQRVALEIFENDALRVVDYYQYEHDWIIRKQLYVEKDGTIKYHSVEWYREDGSAWTQKVFHDGMIFSSESRQIYTASCAIWHNIDYQSDDTISRSIHTTTMLPEGIVEQTIKALLSVKRWEYKPYLPYMFLICS